ncbi:MAG: imidazolonepropionase, partial [Xanthomonadales bacterium]|nr:imidazolonepropionase [Xanthomonadales bacterium]
MTTNTTATHWDGLLTNCRLATMCDGAAFGAITDAALGWKDGRIVFAGRMDALPAAPEELCGQVESMAGAWITPGLVDCHTHLVFGGN